MQIRNDMYKVTPNVSFGASPAPTKKAVRAAFKAAQDLFKSCGGRRAMRKGTISEENLKEIEKAYNKAKTMADQYVENKVNNNEFEKGLDNVLEKYFTKVAQWFGKSKKLISKNASPEDLARSITRAVILGNVFKEAMGTALYTTQALTNTDLDKSERKFVGMYDLFVGITSTGISALLGVGFERAIRNKYSNALKSIGNIPKVGVIVGAATGFTAFILQTIVGKRIIAPAIGKPLAAKARDYLRAKEDAKLAEAKAAENKPETSEPIRVQLNTNNNESHMAA